MTTGAEKVSNAGISIRMPDLMQSDEQTTLIPTV